MHAVPATSGLLRLRRPSPPRNAQQQRGWLAPRPDSAPQTGTRPPRRPLPLPPRADSVAQSIAGAFLEIGSVCALGIALIPKQQRDKVAVGLSAASFNALFPLLLFVSTATTIARAGGVSAELFALPATAIVQAGLGALAGRATAAALGLRGAAARRATVAGAFCNATTLPLVVLHSLAATSPDLLGGGDVENRAVGYLSLYQLGWSVALWTWGLSYLNQDDDDDGEPGGGRRGGPGDGGWLQRLASPPSLGALAGAALGAFPQATQALLLDDSSPAAPLARAAGYLGGGAQPALAMVLALSLVGGVSGAEEGESQPDSGDEDGRRELLASALARGVLAPGATFAAAAAATAAGWTWEGDKALLFVLLAEGAMPTAQVLVLLEQVRRETMREDDGGAGAARIARLLVFQYAALCVPCALWLQLFLEITQRLTEPMP